MKAALRFWCAFMSAWGSLLNVAPPLRESGLEFDFERNTLKSHFDASWGYLERAIDSENR